MTIWILSDLHLFHENMYKFVYTDRFGVERRVRERFKDAAEGDAYMLDRWRTLVKPSDHLYNLGDVTLNRGNHMIHAFIGIHQSLPGHKRLILGNHDHYAVKVYSDAGYQKIKASNVIDGLLLTHYPVHPSSISAKFHACVHGHIHQNQSPPGRYLNMSVENTDYEPVPLEVVKDRAKKLYDIWKETKEAEQMLRMKESI